jgi:acyl-coenzyme A thioesterase PaaI-like protein
MIWLRNSRGRPDALLSIATAGAVAVLAKVVIGGMVVGGWQAGTIDSTLAGVVLASTLGAYTTKRIKIDHDKPGEKAPEGAP